jgi:hypothetical protein
MISVSLKAGGKAVIDLPPGMNGDFIWHGKTYPLKQMHNEFNMPEP